MRNLFIKLFALDYYFKLGNKLGNIPRILPLAFITFTWMVLYLAFQAHESTVDKIISAAPFFIVNIINMSYFRAKPLRIADYRNLDLSQKAKWLFLTEHTKSRTYLLDQLRHIHLSGESEIRIVNEEFVKKYGKQPGHTSGLVSMIPMYLFMIMLGTAYVLVMEL